MKSLLLLCLTFWLATSAQAQSVSPAISESHDLVVLKQSWSKERINWEGDPFGGTVESFDDLRRRIADQRRVDRARGSGNIAEVNKVDREMRSEQVIKARPPAAPRYAFLYKVALRNAGEKTIKLVDWDYVFFDVVTQSETGRVQFTTEQKIGPGKNKEFNAMSRKPPAPTVNVYQLKKNEGQGLDGQVVVMRIEYTDGTVWERP